MKILRKRKDEPADVEIENMPQVNSLDAEHENNETESYELDVTPKSEGSDQMEHEKPETEEPEQDSKGKNQEEESMSNGITEGFLKEARAFAEGKGLSPEEFDEVMNLLKSLRDPANPPTTSMFDMIHKSVNYDRDVANALKQGEIKGRNTQIEKLFMQPEQSDGLPHLNGSSISSQNQSTTIFDLARSAQA